VARKQSDTSSLGRVEPAATPTTTEVPFGQQMVALERAVQQETVACMAERDFEYVPYVPQHVITSYLAEDETAEIEVMSPSLEGLALPLPMMPMTDDELDRTPETAQTYGSWIFIARELRVGPDAVDHQRTQT